MTTKKLMLAALLACAFAPAFADETGEADEPRMERRIVTPGGADIKLQVGQLDELRALDGVPFGGAMMRMHGKPVKNAPYSAEVVSERQQNLADGNQIVNKSSTMSYRDAAGRTRQEVRDPKGELRLVTINDPVASATYVLRPQEKTATRVATGPEARATMDAARAAAEAARARVEQLRKEGKLPMVERHGKHGEGVIVKRVERTDGDSSKQVQEDVRIRVEQDLGDGKGKRMQEMNFQIGPMIAGAIGDMKWAAKATSKDLGSREIDGVKAEGKLRSYEIPAGEVGNRNPIVVTDEMWTSPELQVTLYSKHSDPRHGDTIYRLQGLKRDEPPAALFTVPSDYAVKDAMANIKRRLEQKAQ